MKAPTKRKLRKLAGARSTKWSIRKGAEVRTRDLYRLLGELFQWTPDQAGRLTMYQAMLYIADRQGAAKAKTMSFSSMEEAKAYLGQT